MTIAALKQAEHFDADTPATVFIERAADEMRRLKETALDLQMHTAEIAVQAAEQAKSQAKSQPGSQASDQADAISSEALTALQELDRMTQTIGELAIILSTISAELPDDVRINADRALRTVTLKSLEARLKRDDTPADPGMGALAGDNPTTAGEPELF